jgi:hypothetical protein
MVVLAQVRGAAVEVVALEQAQVLAVVAARAEPTAWNKNWRKPAA